MKFLNYVLQIAVVFAGGVSAALSFGLLSWQFGAILLLAYACGHVNAHLVS